MHFLPANYNFFHVLAHNGKGGVFLDKSRASRITIYIPVAKKVVKSDDKKKYID